MPQNFQILLPLNFLAPRLPQTGHASDFATTTGARTIHAAHGSGGIRRVNERRDRSDWQQLIMGDVDQVGLRRGFLVLSRVWRRDEGRVVHRTASGRRDRSDLEALRIMAVAGTEGPT